MLKGNGEMDKLLAFRNYLEAIEDEKIKNRMEEILNHIGDKYPFLTKEIKWNQPMFINNGTFIIAFSIAKGHIAVAPEKVTLDKFEDKIKKAGYSFSSMLYRIKWDEKVDYDLLDLMIEYNIEKKKDFKYFWRKPGDE